MVIAKIAKAAITIPIVIIAISLNSGEDVSGVDAATVAIGVLVTTIGVAVNARVAVGVDVDAVVGVSVGVAVGFNIYSPMT